MEQKIIKRINWQGFAISIFISLLLSVVYCYFLEKWQELVNIFLSMTALPALFISFAVFNNLSDVKNKLKKRINLKNFMIDGNNKN